MVKNKISHEGELDLNGFMISCYVLENGDRVLSTAGMQRALGLETKEGQRSSGRLDEVLSSKVVKPFISEVNTSAKLESIDAYRGKQKITAYRAESLPEICEVLLKARDYANKNNISLGSRQQSVIEQADILIRALAKVGIVALVDEATGYQYDREKDELQKILKQYISEELLPWQKRFPDVFYKELFRLNGWDFTVKGIKKRPGVVGRWTNSLIYEQLPKGVVEELQSNVPKSSSGNKTARLHQLLTDDIGNPHLTAQINQIVTLFQLSDDMKHMWTQFEKLRLRQSGQMELPFNFDDKGHTIEPKDENTMSDFDKKLKQGLNWNPKDHK